MESPQIQKDNRARKNRKDTCTHSIAACPISRALPGIFGIMIGHFDSKSKEVLKNGSLAIASPWLYVLASVEAFLT
jgi:hypothetical protein